MMDVFKLNVFDHKIFFGMNMTLYAQKRLF